MKYYDNFFDVGCDISRLKDLKVRFDSVTTTEGFAFKIPQLMEKLEGECVRPWLYNFVDYDSYDENLGAYTRSLHYFCLMDEGDTEAWETDIIYDDGYYTNVHLLVFKTEIYPVLTIAVTPPTKTLYHNGETLDLTDMAVTATYREDDKTKDVTSEVTTTPAEGEVVSKSGDIVVTYTEKHYGNDVSATASFPVTYVTMLKELEITNPTKLKYHYGDAIDYTGAKVIAVYSDDTKIDVTSSAVFSPAARTGIVADTAVNISFTNQWKETATGTIELSCLTLANLSATSPDKIDYAPGEIIDYSGLVVTASFSDGSTEDVTNACSITPTAGKAFDPSTDKVIRIEYVLGSIIEIRFGSKALESIAVTSKPTKMHYKSGETIDYSGLVVTAYLENGSSMIVTDACVITTKAGKTFDSATDTNVTISYTDNGVTKTAELTLLTGELQDIAVTKYMDNPCTETMDYSGLVVSATYSDGTADVTDSCLFAPAQGETASSFVTINYAEGSIVKTCTLDLAKIPIELSVVKPPSKTTYALGETVDYSGAVIKMVYADGSTHDVTEFCSYSPSINGAETIVTVSCALSKEPDITGIVHGYINKNYWAALPNRVYSETVAYKVVAGHQYLIAAPVKSDYVYVAVLFTTDDISQAAVNVYGEGLQDGHVSPDFRLIHTPESDGFINIRIYDYSDFKNDVPRPAYLYDADDSVKPITTTFKLTTVKS